MRSGFELPGIPGTLEWQNRPVGWHAGPGNRLRIVAGERSDWFVDPGADCVADNAPAALFIPPDAGFILSARVLVDFASAFDAGVLQLRADGEHWAKLCFEFSPQKRPTIVSVVTRSVSDDCNSVTLPGREVHLRIAKTPRAVAFHYSEDGHYWNLVRYFTPGRMDAPRVGFSAQSPTGKGCKAVFSEIAYRPGVLKDIRSGE